MKSKIINDPGVGADPVGNARDGSLCSQEEPVGTGGEATEIDYSVGTARAAPGTIKKYKDVIVQRGVTCTAVIKLNKLKGIKSGGVGVSLIDNKLLGIGAQAKTEEGDWQNEATDHGVQRVWVKCFNIIRKM